VIGYGHGCISPNSQKWRDQTILIHSVSAQSDIDASFAVKPAVPLAGLQSLSNSLGQGFFDHSIKLHPCASMAQGFHGA